MSKAAIMPFKYFKYIDYQFHLGLINCLHMQWASSNYVGIYAMFCTAGFNKISCFKKCKKKMRMHKNIDVFNKKVLSYLFYLEI